MIFFIVLDLFHGFSFFWTLFDCDSGHDGHFGELPLFEYDVGSFVSRPICMLKVSVPDGSLKDQVLSSVCVTKLCVKDGACESCV